MTCSSGRRTTAGGYYKASLYWLMELAGAAAGIGLSILLYFVSAHFGFPNTGQVAVGGAIAGALGYLAGRPNRLYSRFCPHPEGYIDAFLAVAFGIAWNVPVVFALEYIHKFDGEIVGLTVLTGMMAALFGYLFGYGVGEDSFDYCSHD